MCPNDAEGLANAVDLDQFELFVSTYLSQYFDFGVRNSNFLSLTPTF